MWIQSAEVGCAVPGWAGTHRHKIAIHFTLIGLSFSLAGLLRRPISLEETQLRNTAKEKLRAGKAIVGTLAQLNDFTTLRLLAASAFDFVLIDTQHSPIDAMTLRNMIRVIGPEKDVIVRVVYNEPWLVNQALDSGADGVIIPLTETVEDIERVIRGAKYPPLGLRSWGPSGSPKYGGPQRYADVANDEVLVLPQIETKTAVDNMDSILQVDGVDGIMVGPADLGYSIGFKPHEGYRERDELIQQILDKCLEHNIPWGMFTSTFEIAEKWLSRGGKIATVGTEITHMTAAISRTEADVQALLDRLNR